MIGIQAICDDIIGKIAGSGVFEVVLNHEPKNAPTPGLTAAVFFRKVEPIQGRSGLASTTGRLVFNVRLYSSLIQEPQDAIDPDLVDACDRLLTLFSGDFDLGGNVANVDLLGAHGEPLQAEAGYLQTSEATYRVITITLPLVINDVWSQEV